MKKKKTKQKITKAHESKLSAHQKSRRISADMTFAEVVSKYPETAEIFLKHGMQCIGCPMAMSETIEQGALGHGINVEKLIGELNKKK